MRRRASVLVVAMGLGLLCGLGCERIAKAVKGAAKGAPSSESAGKAASTTSGASAQEASVDTTAKLAAAQWALKQDEIKNDPDGQWATSATASSSYNDAKENENWSPNQTTGAPNVEQYSDNGKAWAPKTQNAGIEWLDLKYPRAVNASEVRVRESCGSGAVIKIELVDEAGMAHLVWGGSDPTTGLNYLLVKFPRTSYRTGEVKVTLATNTVPGWNEIDAVQLVSK